MLPRYSTQQIPSEMNLAALPTRALKVPTDRRSQSCMVITRYELHTPKAPGLERSEDLLVGSFTLRIRHRHSEYFAVTVSLTPVTISTPRLTT